MFTSYQQTAHGLCHSAGSTSTYVFSMMTYKPIIVSQSDLVFGLW